MQEDSPHNELQKAYEARTKENEGMARVLARRAAGLAVRKHLLKKNLDVPMMSLNALLHDESIRNLLPQEIHSALDRLCTRVNPQYQLPFEEDLLVDSQMIIDTLLKTGE